MPQPRNEPQGEGKPEDTPGKGREDAPGQNKPRAETQGDPGPGSLKEGQEVGEEVDAEAPGPITPEHESGSWEQTKREQEAQEKAREEASRKSS